MTTNTAANSLLNAASIKQCKQIANNDDIQGKRAKALLALNGGGSNSEAVEQSGLTVGQVNYLLTRFKVVGMEFLKATSAKKKVVVKKAVVKKSVVKRAAVKKAVVKKRVVKSEVIKRVAVKKAALTEVPQAVIQSEPDVVDSTAAEKPVTAEKRAVTDETLKPEKKKKAKKPAKKSKKAKKEKAKKEKTKKPAKKLKGSKKKKNKGKGKKSK
ncbi:MAG: hypothetical protein HOL04_10485 [Gammaproteobacteria bacterium]|nr:hypothetical protein [Gammaproteobacteria bacterium]MBT4605937.1 hypothetical protein [Thiotrichales bacterium]MBT3471338.1 hypothetical protein [Gammaproteobacteria bacterium]MBT3966812.1 hypothetical protein [Gammaproteobacteria bacterium]MBT4080598.1 hypothetical protein [Gammaproteobacteria bacterium]